MIWFRHVGIALAASLANWINAVLLAVVLYKRGFLRMDARLKHRLPRTLLAVMLMAAALYGGRHLMAEWLEGSFAERAAALSALIGCGLGVYGLAAQVCGAARLSELRALLRRNARVA
jgi:putative peptidoglycan lipid II flippase